MQNIEINTNEIQKIGTMRRVLPQVRKREKKSTHSILFRFFFHCLKCTTNLYFLISKLYLFQLYCRFSRQWQRILTFSI